LARRRPRLSGEDHVDIVPLGRVSPLAVSVVAANLQAVIGLNAGTLPALPDPDYAYLPARDQYGAGKILLALESIPGGARFKLGVVAFDICTPILKFLFGESQLGGKAAVISLYRLADKDPARMYLRAAKIGLHETGHLLGIGHCRALGCLMGFSSTIEKLDALPLRFCTACEYEIARSLRNCFGL
jgi:archaemetzincin